MKLLNGYRDYNMKRVFNYIFGVLLGFSTAIVVGIALLWIILFIISSLLTIEEQTGNLWLTVILMVYTGFIVAPSMLLSGFEVYNWLEYKPLLRDNKRSI